VKNSGPKLHGRRGTWGVCPGSPGRAHVGTIVRTYQAVDHPICLKTKGPSIYSEKYNA
jgi:hypothetical protein